MKKEIKDIINNMPYNITVKNNAVKIYKTLLEARSLSDEEYFPVNSIYLSSINKRYNRILKYFIEVGLIDFEKSEYPDPKDIFNTIIKKKYKSGEYARYKFLL